MQLPGLIDVHVHLREPGATWKEDFYTGTCAALAGGFTTVLAMPNTSPAIADAAALAMAVEAANEKAVCDFGQYAVATDRNAGTVSALASRVAGLKMYLNSTYGELKLSDLTVWMAHVESWPKDVPLVAHAEGETAAAIILLAELADRPVHIAHVSRRDEILLIRKAKERGLKVTCEVGPQHLFLCDEDIDRLGPGRCEVRPMLATAADRDALWANMDVVDCFATDHAPHLLSEKDSDSPPPGYPGLETALPLLWTAVSEGRLTPEALVDRMVDNPRRIFNLPPQKETWVDFDPDCAWEIPDNPGHSRAGWTPFAGMKVKGKVRGVVLRGQEVFRDGEVLAEPGTGRDVRSPS